MTVPALGMREIEALGGKLPTSYSKSVAALALDAIRLHNRLDPLWSLHAGARWLASGLYGCPPGHGWRASCLSLMQRLKDLGYSDQQIQDIIQTAVDGGGVDQELVDVLPNVWPEPIGYTRRFTRGPIPASLYSCLAIVKSGGDHRYVRMTPVPVGGLFAIPTAIAQRWGFNPWSARDSLVYVRNTIEGIIAAWRTGEVEPPSTSSYRDLVFCALLRWMLGERVALTLFAALQRSIVSPSSVLALGTTGGSVDWASSTMQLAGGRDQVLAVCKQASEVMDAVDLIEGFVWSYSYGLTAEGREITPAPRPTADISWAHSWSEVDGLSPMVAAERATDVMEVGTTAGIYNLAACMQPWEGMSARGNWSTWGLDAWQATAFQQLGHYVTRGMVLETLVPSYIGRLPAEQRNLPAPSQKRSWIVRHPVASAAGGVVLAVVLVGVVAAVRRRRIR